MSDHISEEQAIRLADGQAVSAAVASHAESCEACAGRVADHALLSLAVQLDVGALATLTASTPQEARAREPERALEREARPALQLPSSKLPLAIGALVAIAASVPALPQAARELAWLTGSRHFSVQALRQLFSALLNVASGPGWSLAATLGLLGLGVLVASRATRLERLSQTTEGATK